MESKEWLDRLSILFGKTPEQNTKATVAELVIRGTSVIRVDGKLYKVTATEIEVTK